MLLLPDQTYEQYQGQQDTLPSPLIALKHLLNNTNFYPKIPPIPEHTNGSINGKDSSNQSGSLANGHAKIKSINSKNNVHNAAKMERPVDKEHPTVTPDSYDEFFNNIPDYNGEPLGPFSIPNAREISNTTADLLKECEMFLYKYRIRPDFFCRYRKAMDQSNRSAAKPTSWPRSVLESHITTTSREKRKPKSSSPPSLFNPGSAMEFRRESTSP